MNSKRIQAITGDEIVLRHPSLPFDRGATTAVTLLHNGISYYVTSVPPYIPHDYAMVTGEYSIAGAPLRVREVVDTLQIGASAVRYENLYEAGSSTLTVTTHDSHIEGMDLLSALSPTNTPLGVTVTAAPGMQVIAAPTLTIEAKPLGLLDISPLTNASISTLPDWQGTPVDGGELFAGNISRTVPFLMLITETARVDILLFDHDDLDPAVELASELHVTWTP